MSNFLTVFFLERKRLETKKNLCIFVALLLFLALLANDGKLQNDSFQDTKVKFQESEASKVNSYLLYSQYSGYGFRLKYFPSPFFILNNLNVIANLTAHINGGDRLDIYNNVKGDNLFDEGGLLDYTGVTLILIGFFSTLYGFCTYSNQEYLKMLFSFSRSKKHAYCQLFFSRLLILEFLVMVSILIPNIWMLITGKDLFDLHLLIFGLVSFLTSIFFFSIGTIFSRNETLPLAGILFLLIFLIPLGTIKLSNIHKKKIMETYVMEVKALDLIMSAENRIRTELMKYDDQTLENKKKEIIDALLKNEFELIKEQEQRMQACLERKIKQIHLLSSILPTSFYFSVSREMSGGFMSFMNFYNYALEKKDGFIKFYFEKKITKAKQGRGELENYIKGDENIFFAAPNIPYYFWIGIIATLISIILAILISFIRFDRRMTCEDEFKEITIPLKSTTPSYFLTKDDTLAALVYLAFLYRPSVISVNGTNAENNGEPINFFYIAKIRQLPSISKKAWLKALKIKNKIAREWPVWKIFFEAALATGKIIVSNSFLDDRKGEEIKAMEKAISEKKAIFLEIGSDRYQWEHCENPICWKGDKSIDVSDFDGCFQDADEDED